mmetsp:Transcript_26839/g.53524  ORF Transcript_26839/g.53524 Transcript_26839/m.53524 type:complete len:364 (+) Transcript_26839:135-1226(+)|eukprot:CAMPEP_0182467584 /NCGR_PEP_ID=MMETSP1319-20130603/14200_1 /TAXON_ID=172717 /ORGANISM="Bolidomonas pacifica, Strain RCC208" /LENGTH=363 /DNA_ID=CAMNT_0024667685 /DNA_START=50 /DNA_END=1141 /DNA_ORIENTATION=-
MATHKTHKAVVTMGIGGYEMLEYKDISTAECGRNQVLLEVRAMGVNNTDINTRIGWYDQGGDEDEAGGDEDEGEQKKGWNGSATPFPLIQGTDACGVVLEVGDAVENPEELLGKLCIVQSCTKEGWFGTDFAGAFQEKVVVGADRVFVLDREKCKLSDVQLGAIPCSYGTAEAMLLRAGVTSEMKVCVPGASGGVAGAVIDLCARARGVVEVVAIVGKGKGKLLEEAYEGLRVRIVEGRWGEQGWKDAMADLAGTVDVVVDNVGGSGVNDLLKTLKRGGKYVTSGAIAGAEVNVDLRTLYLNDLSMLGSTEWGAQTFPNLVSYIEGDRISPQVTKVFALKDIAKAQEEFLDKTSKIGKFVLTP